MNTTQNKIDFPSANLENAVSKLWNKIHEISGTINFLVERNNELKEKLDSKGVISKEDIAKMKDMERNIESLELENDEYLGRIAKLEAEIKTLSQSNSTLEVFAKNYDILIKSYNKLKNEGGGKAAITALQEELQNALNRIDEAEASAGKLEQLLGEKQEELGISTNAIIRLEKQLEEHKKSISKASESGAEIEKLNDLIDTMNASRDVLIEENDKLKFEIEKLKITGKEESEELKNKIRNFENERIEIRNEFRELNEILVAVEEKNKELERNKSVANSEQERLQSEINDLKQQIDALNEQLAHTSALLKSIEQKDRTIEQLTAEMNGIAAEKLLLENQISDATAKYELLEKDYFESVKSIEELQEELLKNQQEKTEIDNEQFEALQNDLQVKTKMISDFAANEKSMLNKLQYLENELEEKNKSIRNSIESSKNYEDRIVALEALLVQKDKNIDELIRNNKSLNEKIVALEQSSGENKENQQNTEEMQKVYETQLKEMRTEFARLEKELGTKSNNLTVMEIQVKNLQNKIREFELERIKSDEGLSLDVAMRERLIYNLEKQLSKIESIIGKQ